MDLVIKSGQNYTLTEGAQLVDSEGKLVEIRDTEGNIIEAIDGVLQIDNLTIEEGASLIIKKFDSLDLQEDIHVYDNASLTLEKDNRLSSESGSLFLVKSGQLILEGNNVVELDVFSLVPRTSNDVNSILVKGTVNFAGDVSVFPDNSESYNQITRIIADLPEGGDIGFKDFDIEKTKITFVENDDYTGERSITTPASLSSNDPNNQAENYAIKNGFISSSVEGDLDFPNLKEYLLEKFSSEKSNLPDGFVSYINNNGVLYLSYSNTKPAQPSLIVTDGESYSFKLKDGKVLDDKIDIYVRNKELGVSEGSRSIYNLSSDDIYTEGRDVKEITEDSGDISLFMGGNDYANIQSGNKIVSMGDGNDGVNISVNSGETIVYGGKGDDIFYLWSDQTIDSKDKIAGGAGYDTLFFHNPAEVTSSLVSNLDSIERFQFKQGGNKIVVDQAMIDQSGENNNNINLRGFSSENSVTSILVDTSALDRDVAKWKVSVFDSSLKIKLADGADQGIRAQQRGSDIEGGNGNDIIRGGAGVDALSGDAGNDELLGYAGDDILIGGAGDDKIYGGFDNDTIEGGAGKDLLEGGDGDDKINGGDGDDIIYGGKGSDIIDGGEGYDTVIYSADSDSSLDSLNSIERVQFTKSGSIVIDQAMIDQSDEKNNNINLRGLSEDGSDVSILVDTSALDIDVAKWKVSVFDSSLKVKLADGADQGIRAQHRGSDIEGGDGNDIIRGNRGIDKLAGDAGNDQLFGYAGDDILIGGAGDDKIYGGFDNDTIEGGDGDDLLEGGDGDDKINGDAGDDIIYGGKGSDIIDGGEGYDTVIYSADSDSSLDSLNSIERIQFDKSSSIVIDQAMIDQIDEKYNNINLRGLSEDGSSVSLLVDTSALDRDVAKWKVSVFDSSFKVKLADGADQGIRAQQRGSNIEGGNGNDIIRGGAGVDFLLGDAGNDELIGYAGDDIIIGGEGYDTIEGGDGDDSILGGDGEDTILGGSGDDEIHGDKGNDEIDGGLGNDLINGDDGDDLVYARSGDDKIYGGTGSDIIDGGEGQDLIIGGSGDDKVYGGDGEDTIHGNSGNDSLEGGFGSDALFGGAGDDTILGGAGDDRIYGEINADEKLDGEAGNDTLDGGEGDDTILAGAGDDKVYGGNGDDILGGETGNDTIEGGDGNDIIYGGSGNDSLEGGFGSDVLFGGAGEDTILGGEGDDTIFGENNTDENLDEESSNDTLDGGDGDDVILGGAGDDKILGGVGDDELYGGNGNDRITAGDGDDEAFGGNGNDRITGGLGNDLISGDDGDDLVYAGSGEDTVFGGEGNDRLFGRNGDDALNGGAGNDYIYGENDNDTINGDAGDDNIFGGRGNDTLNGGSGKDILYGNDGNDIFVFSNLSDSTKAETDVIKDFEQGSDKIDLSAFEFEFDDLIVTDSGNSTLISVEDSEFSVELKGNFELESDDFNF